MSIQVVVVGGRGKRLGRPVYEAILNSNGEFNLAAVVQHPDRLVVINDPVEFGGALVTGSMSAARDAMNRCALSTSPEQHEGGAVFYATRANALLGRLQEAVACGFTIHVIGTTGLDQATLQAIKELAGQTRIVLSPNFSRSVWVLADQCASLASELPEAEVEVIEGHHRGKLDAPSGTGILLARVMAAARGQEFEDVLVLGARGVSENRAEQICVHSLRGGTVKGEHRVRFLLNDEQVEIAHIAETSALFARGALPIIRWAVLGEENGLYGMPDVLDLKFLKMLGVS